MTKYYRARITLEEITPLPTPDNHSRENTRIAEIAEITVTGGNPGAAMNQIVSHAQDLRTFHNENAEIDPHALAMKTKKDRDEKGSWTEAIKPKPATDDREAFIPKEPEKR